MARKKSKSARPRDPQQTAAIRRGMMHTLASLVFIGLLGFGFYRLRHYVMADVLKPEKPPTVVLKNRPLWMSDVLARQILSSLQPTESRTVFDRQLLIQTAATLNKNPWIKEVRQVRRAFGREPGDTIEIDCDFRAPIALVHWKDYYWLVDGQAVKLPEQFTAAQLKGIIYGPDGRLNIRIVEGISEPPVESGRTWAGDDLVAALDMIKLLFGQSYAEEITRVDISNFKGRVDQREGQIKLITKYDTSIHWGQPISSQDFFAEVPPNQKLQHLQEVYQKFRRIDAGMQWIDVRFDKITYPSAAANAHADSAR
ncbi:MAG TPA: hypothetical protein VHD56_16985 [Tepidisphaeraceae bacterium]|nr:hypothetical protein [Tepidisphaeraceae bacterium]